MKNKKTILLICEVCHNPVDFQDEIGLCHHCRKVVNQDDCYGLDMSKVDLSELFNFNEVIK